jgi:ribulose-phosphate 3-epimerase
VSAPRVEIAASILAADFARLGDQVAAAERAGADAIHVDVMDGRFVPEITVGPVVIEAVRRSTRLPVDVHLMVVEPERHVDACIRSGASVVTVHQEAAVHLHRVVTHIKERGARAAVALNPGTPLAAVEPLLPVLDMVLLMTVDPGYAGQRFLRLVLPKVRQLREWVRTRDLSLRVQVDGGITPQTAAEAVRAGADVVVAASAIFHSSEGVEAAVARLRRAVEAAAGS